MRAECFRSKAFGEVVEDRLDGLHGLAWIRYDLRCCADLVAIVALNTKDLPQAFGAVLDAARG